MARLEYIKSNAPSLTCQAGGLGLCLFSFQRLTTRNRTPPGRITAASDSWRKATPYGGWPGTSEAI